MVPDHNENVYATESTEKLTHEVEIQTIESHHFSDISYNVLHEQLKTHKDLINKLTDKILKMNLNFEFKFIENSDDKVYRYTGLPTRNVFEIVFKLISGIEMSYNQKWNVLIVPKKEQLLMTLMKLRLNLRHFDLAQRFGCSIATVSNIVRTWTLALHEILFVQLMSKIPSRKKNKTSLPMAFACFSECRIILDCTDESCDKPKNIFCQRSTFSTYKGRNTFKPLLGCAPNGVVTYSSDLYPGSLSDKAIVEHSGIASQLISGDLVLADKGFLIEEIMPYGVNVNIPPFLTTTQFTKHQVNATETIARARVHIERAICRIKYFHILDYIPSEMFNIANEIFQVIISTVFHVFSGGILE